jgi:hypothetical protein
MTCVLLIFFSAEIKKIVLMLPLYFQVALKIYTLFFLLKCYKTIAWDQNTKVDKKT